MNAMEAKAFTCSLGSCLVLFKSMFRAWFHTGLHNPCLPVSCSNMTGDWPSSSVFLFLTSEDFGIDSMSSCYQLQCVPTKHTFTICPLLTLSEHEPLLLCSQGSVRDTIETARWFHHKAANHVAAKLSPGAALAFFDEPSETLVDASEWPSVLQGP